MARNKIVVPDAGILEAALAGLEIQKQKVDDQIAQVKAMLGMKPAAVAAPAAVKKVRGKRRLSAAARKRIAAAQKKRWAAYRQNKAQG